MQNPQKAKKNPGIWNKYLDFLVREAGLEFQGSGIYGIFATFVFANRVFCPNYSIISNQNFCIYPIKGSGKGKNKGNQTQSLTKENCLCYTP